MTSISKNVYINKVDDILHKYNNKKHRTIKIKPIDVKDNTYIDFRRSCDHVRISKYKNIFANGYAPNWPEEAFVIKKVTNTVPWTMLLMILMAKKLLEHFMKKNCKR